MDDVVKLDDLLAWGSATGFAHDPDREPDVDGIADEWIWNDRIGEDWVDFSMGLQHLQIIFNL